MQRKSFAVGLFKGNVVALAEQTRKQVLYTITLPHVICGAEDVRLTVLFGILAGWHTIYRDNFGADRNFIQFAFQYTINYCFTIHFLQAEPIFTEHLPKHQAAYRARNKHTGMPVL